jgi:DNA-dependent RNA polymerase auxiliary subunit epsilon
MEYLKQENEALRRELTELLELTIETNNFLRMVLDDLHKWGMNDDIEYVELLVESSNEKIFKLKSLI